MVLPLYTNLVKHDLRLLEAAYDLGARPWKAFLSVTLPLSRAGIIAGSMLVTIPVVGEFVIPELLGGPDTLMIGRVLWNEFFNNRDWPVASAVAIVMLLLLLVPILIFHRYEQSELEQRADMSARRAASSPLLKSMLVLGFVFLYAPILSLMVYSFNESQAGHGVVGLLGEVVRRAVPTTRDDGRGLGQHPASPSSPPAPRWCWARSRRW